MWPNVPAFSKADRPTGTASCPGKVFLWGEYGILAGLPAWVLAVGPRFQANWGKNQGGDARKPFVPHPESPLGRLLSRFAETFPHAADRVAWFRENFVFQDAHSGWGGFGGSTAEFILGAQALGLVSEGASSAEALWRIYRELHSSEPVLPSGADLLSQVRGGLTQIQLLEPAQVAGRLKIELLPRGSWLKGLMLFSASQIPGRKVATHRHLPELKDRGFFEPSSPLVRALEPSLSQISTNLSNSGTVDLRALGRGVDSFAEAIRELGLEHPATWSDRKHLRALPGVFGVKGLGALQADAVLVLAEPDPVVQQRIKTEALALGLSPVSLHSGEEPGIQFAP